VLTQDEHSQLSFDGPLALAAGGAGRAGAHRAGAAAGEPNSAIAERMQPEPHDGGQVAQSLLAQRLEGLYDELRPGKPRTINDERLQS